MSMRLESLINVNVAYRAENFKVYRRCKFKNNDIDTKNDGGYRGE